MLRAAYAILRDQHDAEDAVSAAIVKVAARLASGHPVDDPDAYLIQSVRNAALDQRRASARRRENRPGNPSLPHVSSSVTDPEIYTNIQQSGPDIVDQVIECQRSAELQAAVQQTINGLAEREAVMLSMLLAGGTRAEIGSKFNLTGQRVGQLLKKPIADLLGQLGIDAPGQRKQRPAGEQS
jgi:RNA polymerase sigma factor (sigma-70 family)